jgi:hypothetical protein
MNPGDFETGPAGVAEGLAWMPHRPRVRSCPCRLLEPDGHGAPRFRTHGVHPGSGPGAVGGGRVPSVGRRLRAW